MKIQPVKREFPLGLTTITPMAQEVLEDIGESYSSILAKHSQCDWGCVSKEDWESNDEALSNGGRLFSAYILNDNKFWIITEANRASTTILLPCEY
jgi:hypothetical protein